MMRKSACFDRINRIKLLVTKQIKFFYFFQIWPVTMCAFGRFSPLEVRRISLVHFITGLNSTFSIHSSTRPKQ